MINLVKLSRCPHLAEAGISAISGPVFFLHCLVSYIIGLDIYFIHQSYVMSVLNYK